MCRPSMALTQVKKLLFQGDAIVRAFLRSLRRALDFCIHVVESRINVPELRIDDGDSLAWMMVSLAHG